jgi:hypothetical protein
VPEDIETESRVEEFKKSLELFDPKYLVQRNIIFGGCAVLDDDQYMDLRTDVSKQFNVHPNDVLVVGSAKLGFSIAPHKRYRSFGDESDIDVVIVNGKLFDDIWYLVFKAWKEKIIWENEANFYKYLFRGWIRPDFFPPSQSMQISKAWWEYFRKITSSEKFGPYKIAGAVYKSWQFLELYQVGAMTACKESLEMAQ